MSDSTRTDLFTRRWHALLAENEHLEAIASFTPPFSAQQMVQLKASAARRQQLTLKLHDLVDEWAADVPVQ